MKKVLITPMDWGLGHATRCIPIIRELLRRNCIVLIAGNGDSLVLLKNEFPQLTFFYLTGYNPIYSNTDNMVWKMATQLPKFSRVIAREHEQVEAIIEQHHIDLVISDNRYGCWSEKIPSVIITHQLNILMPKHVGWLSKSVRRVNAKMVKKFSVCWIPDFPDQNESLAGNLTSYDGDRLKNVTYIGPLSRFHRNLDFEIKYDVICILSGPEPQRNFFEKVVKEQLNQSGLTYFVVRGIPLQPNSGQLNEVDFLNSEALQTVILQSAIVIARSGYSTVMDLAALGKKPIFVPTPGQTEQEYLAKRWKEKRVAYAMPQYAFDLTRAMSESKTYTGFPIDNRDKGKLLSNTLDQVLR